MRSPRNTYWSTSGYGSTRSTPSPRSSRASSIESRSAETTSAMEVFESIFKGRKSWKTLRGGEMVWPAKLEAALIEGLELYQPDDSRETRLLGRFPMRNRFISEHILRKTGKVRSAKQVGSRLQQLRETCTGERLMHLLSPTRRPEIRSQSVSHCDSASSNGGGSVPITPTDDVSPYSLARGDHAPTHHTFSIDILPQNEIHTSPTLRSSVSSSISSPFPENVIHLSDHARHILDIDPTLTFLSHVPITASSFFQVYLGGSVVFSEMTTLSLCETGDSPNGSLLYATSLVPNYWQTICQSQDPAKFSIFQEVAPIGQDSASAIFTATYRLTYPADNAAVAPKFETSGPIVIPEAQFDFSYDELQTCFTADGQSHQYGKPEHMYGGYASYDSAWLTPAVQRSAIDKTLHADPAHGFEDASPISPMSGTFSSDIMHGAYRANFDLM